MAYPFGGGATVATICGLATLTWHSHLTPRCRQKDWGYQGGRLVQEVEGVVEKGKNRGGFCPLGARLV